MPAVVVMFEDEQLHECALLLRHFPLAGALTRAQAYHRATDADALAGLERDFADQPVTLVEQTQHGDTLGHRRYPGHGGIIGLHRQFRRSGRRRWRRRGIFTLARRQRQGRQQRGEHDRATARHHQASGDQG